MFHFPSQQSHMQLRFLFTDKNSSRNAPTVLRTASASVIDSYCSNFVMASFVGRTPVSVPHASVVLVCCSRYRYNKRVSSFFIACSFASSVSISERSPAAASTSSSAMEKQDPPADLMPQEIPAFHLHSVWSLHWGKRLLQDDIHCMYIYFSYLIL
mgnify:CR=1 FL=1